MLKSDRTTARNKFKCEQYIPPLPKSQNENIMVARSRGGGRFTKCIQVGVKPTLTALPPTNSKKCPRAPQLLNEAIAEYVAMGILRRMSQPEPQSTRHWSPSFRRCKAYSGKTRMIIVLRQLSSAWVQPPKFKTDNWQTVGECLSLDPHLTWGAVVDLLNFFFHLGGHPSVGRWIRIKTEMGDFQWTALPVGLHYSPFWTDRLAQVVEKTLRHKGVHLFWYGDEILILGTVNNPFQRTSR